MSTFRITASGKAAHAGNNHQQGANAIWALALLIDRLADVEGVVFTAIRGGTSRNTVPDAAHVTLDGPDALLDHLDLSSLVPGTTLAVERL